MTEESNQPVLIELKSRKEVAERTLALQFTKPANWTFKPGQSVDLTLPNPPETDAEGNTRALSIASAPGEDFLMFATRLRDTAFKRSCHALSAGAKVKIDGPFGNLTLHNKASRPAVLLAGGIGITPFRSMVVHAAAEKLPHRIFLFYSNRRPEDAPFLEELDALQKQNPNFCLIATMTDMAKSQRQWTGETSQINQDMLARHLKGVDNAIYYLAGPPGMVKGLQTVLNAAGVDDDDIRTEEFGGY